MCTARGINWRYTANMEAVKRKIISDKLAMEKTGLTLEECFQLLDKKGAATRQHKEIFVAAGSINKLKPLGDWNLNLLTTAYEWSRGIKERGQKEKGFEVSVSKTVAVPAGTLYTAWIDEAIRKKWLKEKIVFRKTTAGKSARITWIDNTTSVSVEFYPKGETTSQVVVHHLKLPAVKKADELRTFWTIALSRLKSLMED